jgi:hypothetical protein
VDEPGLLAQRHSDERQHLIAYFLDDAPMRSIKGTARTSLRNLPDDVKDEPTNLVSNIGQIGC